MSTSSHERRSSPSRRRVRVSMIGSLPPIKGVSAYTSELVAALSRREDLDLDLIGFSSIYPRWAYPGGDPDERGQSDETHPLALSDVKQRRSVAWYNPLSWIGAGLGARGCRPRAVVELCPGTGVRHDPRIFPPAREAHRDDGT